MKHLKTKLMASVAMLMVATVMISSASFAWFTLATAPEVKGISTNVATNGSLEIALADSTAGLTIAYKTPAAGAEGDTGKNTKWGNLVDISNYFTAVEPESTLKPVAYDSESGDLEYPKFGGDGRLDALTALVPAAAKIATGEEAEDTAYVDGSIILLTDAASDATDLTGTNNWAYRVDYFMRTNTAGDISLLIPGDDVDLDRGNGVDGAGSKVTSEDAGISTDDIQVAIQVYDLGDELGDGADVTLSADDLINLGTEAAPETFKVLRTEQGEGDAKAMAFVSDKLFTAAANNLYLVSMYVYWDGASATNESMAQGGDIQVNVQFQHSETLTNVFDTPAEEEEEEAKE